MLSAVAKLSSMEGFELYIFSFGFAGFDECSLAARAIVIAEFILGLLLALNVYPRLIKCLTALSLAGFSAFLIWRAWLGDTESCHCMGDLAEMNPVQSLIKNAVLLLLLLYVWKDHGRRINRQLLVLIASIALATAAVFMVSPPDFYHRTRTDSHDLSADAFRPVADSLGLSNGRRAVCFYSATCEHCRHCASKMAGIIRRHDIPSDSVHVLFMQTHVNQDSVSVAFYSEHGEGLELAYSYLHPYEFIPLTDGAMPIVVLMQDGEVVKEYDYTTIDEEELASFFNR